MNPVELQEQVIAYPIEHEAEKTEVENRVWTRELRQLLIETLLPKGAFPSPSTLILMDGLGLSV